MQAVLLESVSSTQKVEQPADLVQERIHTDGSYSNLPTTNAVVQLLALPLLAALHSSLLFYVLHIHSHMTTI